MALIGIGLQNGKKVGNQDKMKIKQIIINILDRVRALNKRQLVFLVSMTILLVIAIPLTLIQVQQQQQTRQRANVEDFILTSKINIIGDSLQDEIALENKNQKDITGTDVLISFPNELNEFINIVSNSQAEAEVIVTKKSGGNIQFVVVNPTENSIRGNLALGILTVDISSLKDADQIKKLAEIKVIAQITSHADFDALDPISPTDALDFISATPIKETDLASLLSQIALDTNTASDISDQTECGGSLPAPTLQTGRFTIYGIICNQYKTPISGIDVTLTGYETDAKKTDSNGFYSFPNLKSSSYSINAFGKSSLVRSLTQNTRVDLKVQNNSAVMPTSTPTLTPPTSTLTPTSKPTATPTPALTPIPSTLTSPSSKRTTSVGDFCDNIYNKCSSGQKCDYSYCNQEGDICSGSCVAN